MFHLQFGVFKEQVEKNSRVFQALDKKNAKVRTNPVFVLN